MKRYPIIAVCVLLFIIAVVLSANRERRTRAAPQQQVVITSDGKVVAPGPNLGNFKVIANLPKATNTPPSPAPAPNPK